MTPLLLTDSDAFAGTERHMLDLAVGLRELGVCAVIGCPADTPLACETAAQNIEHVPVPCSTRAGALVVRRLVSSGRFDLIHAHNGRSAMFAALAGAGACGARRNAGGNCRLISTLHFINLARENRSGLKAFASRRFHAWLDFRIARWIAISDAVARAAIERDPQNADRIVRVHNGTSLNQPTQSRELVRQSLDVSAQTTVLLTVARLEREKDVGIAIEAAKKLAGQYPDGWRWFIVGDGKQAGELQSQIDTHWPNGGPIQLLGRRSNVCDLMNAADLLVHPAPAEPFGLVLIEAMAMSLPVIASSGGAAPEIVVPGETGLHFESGDAESLTATIGRFIADEHAEHRMELGQAGRARFENLFTAKRMASGTLAVYRNALQNVDSDASELEAVTCQS